MSWWKRAGRQHGAGWDSSPNPCKIFVGNISYRVSGSRYKAGDPYIYSRGTRPQNDDYPPSLQITREELADFFSKFGQVVSCHVVKDHKKGWSRG